MAFETLTFNVSGGKIEALNTFLAADSVEYAIVEFTFDESWEGLLKTAVFRKGENVYHVVLEENKCKIPFEVITDGIMYVSCFGVFGDVRATTVEVAVRVEKSGFVMCVPNAPSPDPYNYFLEKATEQKELSEQYSQISAEKAEAAEKSASGAEETMVEARICADSASIACAESYANEKLTRGYVQSVENIKKEAEDFKYQSEHAAHQAAVSAGLTYEAVENHNKSKENTHPDIRQSVSEALAIAKGKANSLVFNTEAELMSWAENTGYLREDGKTPLDLNIGDNLYVVELGVPDYWWDGEKFNR